MIACYSELYEEEESSTSIVFDLKSIRVHFAPAEIAITFELLSQFIRFLD